MTFRLLIILRNHQVCEGTLPILKNNYYRNGYILLEKLTHIIAKLKLTPFNRVSENAAPKSNFNKFFKI